MGSSQKTVRLVISGRVQGVGYRNWATRIARKFGLTGWVRNRQDGTVEAVACGPVEAIDAFIAVCRKGAPVSQVADVVVSEVNDGEVFSTFERRPTV